MSRSVIAIVDDLFFASKIRGTAEELGVRPRFARSIEVMLEGGRIAVPVAHRDRRERSTMEGAGQRSGGSQSG